MRRAAFLFAGAVCSPFLAGMLVGACSDEPAPKEDPLLAVTFESGSRLRANVYVADDGTELFLDFHDTELELDCSFEETTAGYRCLPAHSKDLSFGYSDELCTEPLALVLPEGCLGKSPFVVARGEDARCLATPNRPVSAVYQATGAVSGDGSAFKGSPGACVPELAIYPWRAVEEMPLESFALAEERLTEPSAGMATRMLLSEDGAKVAIGLFDAVREEPCTAFRETAAGNAGRCIEADARVLTDPGIRAGDCEGPLAAITDIDCGTVEVLVDRSASCLSSLDVFTAGTPEGQGFAVTDAVCNELTATYPAPVQATPLGDPVDIGDYPLVRERPLGTGRVTARVATSDAGASLGVMLSTDERSHRVLFDEELGQPCVPLEDEEGVLRCVSGPLLVPTSNAFADAGCETPAVLFDTCGSIPPSVGFYASCGSGPVTGAFGIGAPAPQLWGKVDEGCFGVGAIPSSFVVTGDRDLDEFPRLEKKRQ